VQPNVISAGNSLVYGPGLELVTLDEPNSVSIQPRDRYANFVYDANFNFDVRLQETAPEREEYYLNVSVEPMSDGTYQIRYVPTEQEDLRLSVTYNGQHLRGSPADISLKEVVKAFEYSAIMIPLIQAGGAGSCCLCVLFAVLVQYWKAERIIKFSQRHFLHVTLLGLLISNLNTFLMCLPAQVTNCVVVPWLGHLSYAITFSCLFAKTWRVAKIANNTMMRKVKVTNLSLWIRIAAICTIVMMYLTVWTIIDPPKPVTTLTGRQSVVGDAEKIVRFQYKVCASSTQWWSEGLLFFEFAMLMYGVSLAIQTRNVHEVFAESKYIGISIYNICFVGVVVVSAIYGLKVEVQYGPEFLLSLQAGAVQFSSSLTAAVIFLPKFWMIYQGHYVSFSDFNTTKTSKSPTNRTKNSQKSNKETKRRGSPLKSLVESDETDGDIEMAAKVENGHLEQGTKNAAKNKAAITTAREVSISVSNPMPGSKRKKSKVSLQDGVIWKRNPLLAFEE
jgi:hypothetical protein